VEQEPSKVGQPAFKVFWHPGTKQDFAKMPPSLVDSIVRAATHRLSRAPQLIGEPLKGTVQRLWKIRFSKYRIIYTIQAKRDEVWILAVLKRDIAYRHRHVESLLRLAVALQEEVDQPK